MKWQLLALAALPLACGTYVCQHSAVILEDAPAGKVRVTVTCDGETAATVTADDLDGPSCKHP